MSRDERTYEHDSNAHEDGAGMCRRFVVTYTLEDYRAPRVYDIECADTKEQFQLASFPPDERAAIERAMQDAHEDYWQARGA